MAKLSQINRNKKREKMVAQYAGKRSAWAFLRDMARELARAERALRAQPESRS